MSEDQPQESLEQQVQGLMAQVKRLIGNCAVLVLVCILGMTEHQWSHLLQSAAEKPAAVPESRTIVDGVDVDLGLLVDENYELVGASCSGCHSLKLVTQNRATREGWKELIVWMQETQKLWDLGENEPLILDYLAKNYGPQKEGRRRNLENVEWYALEE